MIKGRKLVAVVVLIMAIVASIFEGSRAEENLCNITEDGLNACKPAVTAPNPADPSQDCCNALQGADLKCLCDYKNNHPLLLSVLGIDPDLAMKLPAKCNIPNAPSTC